MFVNHGRCSIVAANRVLIHLLLGVALVSGRPHRYPRHLLIHGDSPRAPICAKTRSKSEAARFRARPDRGRRTAFHERVASFRQSAQPDHAGAAADDAARGEHDRFPALRGGLHDLRRGGNIGRRRRLSRQALRSALGTGRLSRSVGRQGATDFDLRHPRGGRKAPGGAGDPGRLARLDDPRRRTCLLVAEEAGRNPSSLDLEVQHRRADRFRRLRAGRSRVRPGRTRRAGVSRARRRRLDVGVWRGLYRAMARSHEPIETDPVVRSLAAVAFSVPDYDEAIAWFADALGFELIEDTPVGDGKRWVVVAASRDDGARLVLQKTEGTPGGNRRVGYFLETDDFDRDRATYLARGVRFLEAPRRESYGIVAVFADPWGGKWDLIQPTRAVP